jgi:hypothetical protein
MAVNNLLAFVLHWSGLGEEGQTTFWFQGSGSTHDGSQLNSALTEIDSLMGSNESPSNWAKLTDLLANVQAYDQISLYEYAVAPGKATALAHLGVNHAGTGAMTMPLQACAVATLRTELAGARHRGRQYWPIQAFGISGTDGQLSLTEITAVENVAAQTAGNVIQGLDTSLSIANLDWVVFSRAAAATTPITAVVVDSRVDVQRRRAASQQPLRTFSGEVHPA